MDRGGISLEVEHFTSPLIYQTHYILMCVAVERQLRPVQRFLNHCWQSDSTQQRVPAWSPWQLSGRLVANHDTYPFTLETPGMPVIHTYKRTSVICVATLIMNGDNS